MKKSFIKKCYFRVFCGAQTTSLQDEGQQEVFRETSLALQYSLVKEASSVVEALLLIFCFQMSPD